jgi:hypothetical protein
MTMITKFNQSHNRALELGFESQFGLDRNCDSLIIRLIIQVQRSKLIFCSQILNIFESPWSLLTISVTFVASNAEIAAQEHDHEMYRSDKNRFM